MGVACMVGPWKSMYTWRQTATDRPCDRNRLNPGDSVMAAKTWTLTDVDQDIYVDQITLGPEQVGGPARGYSVTKRTLRGGLRDGVDVIEVHNGGCDTWSCPPAAWASGGPTWAACNSAGGRRSKGRCIRSSCRCGKRPASAGSTASTSCWCVAAWRATGPRSFRPTARCATHCTAGSPTLPAHKVEVTIDGDRARSRWAARWTRPGCSATSSD